MVDNFSSQEIKDLEEKFDWMRDYYGQLKGAVVDDVSIAVYEDNTQLGFPCITFRLSNGMKYECDILSAFDVDMPGFIGGLPYSDDK